MKRGFIFFLTGVLLLLSLTTAGCQRQMEEDSSALDSSQVKVQEPASSTSVSSSPSSQSVSSLYDGGNTRKNMRDSIPLFREALAITHPEDSFHGKMNNGYIGIQSESFEKDNIHMTFPITSSHPYVHKESKTKHDPYYWYSNMAQFLRKDPFIFLNKYDLESEGTDFYMTYHILEFDDYSILVHYVGRYRNAEGQSTPIHFIRQYPLEPPFLDLVEEEPEEEYTYVYNMKYFPEYMFYTGDYEVDCDDSSKQQAAEDYVRSMSQYELRDWLLPVYEGKYDIDYGKFPPGYSYCHEGKAITMVEVSPELGDWITITADIEDMAEYNDLFLIPEG